MSHFYQTSQPQMSRCPKCAGAVFAPGVAVGYGGPLCSCPALPYTQGPIQYGWVCPHCTKDHSPLTPTCDCKGAK